MEKPTEIVIDFSCASCVSDMEDIVVFSLPGENFSAYASLVGSPERKHELDLGYNIAIDRTLTVKFPEEYKLAGLPENKEVKYEFGMFTRKYESISDTTIRHSASLEIDVPTISAADYADFKNLIETAAREDRAQIILKKTSSDMTP